MFSAEDSDFDDEAFFDVALEIEEPSDKVNSSKKRKSFEINDNMHKNENISNSNVSNNKDPLGLNKLLQVKNKQISSVSANKYIFPYGNKISHTENIKVNCTLAIDEEDVNDNILSSALDSCVFEQNNAVASNQDMTQSNKLEDFDVCNSNVKNVFHGEISPKREGKKNTILHATGSSALSNVRQSTFCLAEAKTKVDKPTCNTLALSGDDFTSIPNTEKKTNHTILSPENYSTDSELDFSLDRSPEWKPNFNIANNKSESGKVEIEDHNVTSNNFGMVQNKKVMSNFSRSSVQSNIAAVKKCDLPLSSNISTSTNCKEPKPNGGTSTSSLRKMNYDDSNDMFNQPTDTDVLDLHTKKDLYSFNLHHQNNALRSQNVQTTTCQTLRNSSFTNSATKNFPNNSFDNNLKSRLEASSNQNSQSESVKQLSEQSEYLQTKSNNLNDFKNKDSDHMLQNSTLKNSVSGRLPYVEINLQCTPSGFKTPKGSYRQECSTPVNNSDTIINRNTNFTPVNDQRNRQISYPVPTSTELLTSPDFFHETPASGLNVGLSKFVNQPSEFDTPVSGMTKPLPVQTVVVTPSSSRVTSSSSGKRKRKFPGPAGVLPKLKPGMSLNDVNTLKPVSPSITPRKTDTSDIPSSQNWEDKFHEDAWTSMQKDLEPKAKDLLEEFCIQAVLRKASKKLLPRGKVPVICVLIDQLSTHNADASVVLRDVSGEMKGTIHRQLMRDHPNELIVGTVLVLRQCGVFSPAPKSHYLNITPNNVVRIYSKSVDGQTSKSSLSDFTTDDFIIPEPLPVSMDATHSDLRNSLNNSRNHNQLNRAPFGVVGSNTGFNIARNNSPTFQQAYSPQFQGPRGYQTPRFSGRVNNHNQSYSRPGFQSPVVNRPSLNAHSNVQSGVPQTLVGYNRPQNSNFPLNSPNNNFSLKSNYNPNMSINNTRMLKSNIAVAVPLPKQQTFYPKTKSQYSNNRSIQPPPCFGNNNTMQNSAGAAIQTVTTNDGKSTIQRTPLVVVLNNSAGINECTNVTETPETKTKKGFTFKKSPVGTTVKDKFTASTENKDICVENKIQSIDFSLQDDNLDELLTGMDEEMLTDM